MAFLNPYWIFTMLLLPAYGLWAQPGERKNVAEKDVNNHAKLTTSGQTQIISQSQIESSGYSQLSDLFQLLEGWTFSTYTGNKWVLQGNGSGQYTTQNWQLLVDGVRIDLMNFDAKNINSLGFTVQDIDRIEVINAQGLYFGEFNDKGTIHFITKKVVDGLSVRMMISNGNEIGDPHLNVVNNPLLNVHELGTTIGNYVGFRKSKWQIESSQNFGIYFYRDTSQYMRRNVAAIYPQSNHGNIHFSGRSNFTYLGDRVKHQIILQADQGDDVVTPLNLDKPYVVSGRNVSAAYLFKIELKKGELDYRMSLNRRFLEDDVFVFNRHRYQSGHYNLNFKSTKKRNQRGRFTALGISLETMETSREDSILEFKNLHYFIRPYASYFYDINKSSSLFTDFALSGNQTGILPKLAMGFNKTASKWYQWSIIAAFSQRFNAENNDYVFFLSQIQPFEIMTALPALKTLDYHSQMSVTEKIKINFGTGLRELANNYHFLTVDGILHPAINNKQLTKSDALRWVNQVSIQYKNKRSLDLELNYLNTNPMAGSEAFHRNIPVHKLTAIATFYLPARLSIWTRYYYQSETTWQNPDLVTQNNFSADLPGFVQLGAANSLDFGVNKKMLMDCLTINLTMRNVLNQNERFQQFGAAFYTRLLFFVRLNFAGLYKK